MEYRETWGIALSRIADFFSAQEDSQSGDGRHFLVGGAAVTLTALPENMLARYALPRTEVVISGSEEAAGEVHRRFFMRFLSAGG